MLQKLNYYIRKAIANHENRNSKISKTEQKSNMQCIN